MRDGFDAIEACRAALIEPLTDDVPTIEALMEVVQADFGD
jgi:nitric oxide reductase NorQ protein